MGKVDRLILTSFPGTHKGVPTRNWPASTLTPITIGSRDLNTHLGTIFTLHGKICKVKPNLHYTCCITKKRAASNRACLRDLTPGKHSFVGDTKADLSDPDIHDLPHRQRCLLGCFIFSPFLKSKMPGVR